MVNVNDIKDRDTLKAWLEQIVEQKGDEEGQRIAAKVAHRAAMRALPMFWEWALSNAKASELDWLALSALRSLACNGVAGVWSSSKVRRSAAEAASAYAYVAAVARIDTAALAAAEAADTAQSENAIDAAAQAAAAYTVAIYSAAPVAYSTKWRSVHQDAHHISTKEDVSFQPLWDGRNPLEENWSHTKSLIAQLLDRDAWSFWIDWYEDALAGRLYRPQNEALLTAIALIDDADWEKGPSHIAAMIRDLQAELEPSKLAEATPVEFTFDKLAEVMRLVGIDDNLRHLKDPAVVGAFIDDAEQVRDGLQDFSDYASALSGGGNYAGVLRRAADKVLTELERVDEKIHIRPERLVMLGQDLELFSKDEKAAADLGEALSGRLEARLGDLKDLCRRHFGPSYLTLAPLSNLPPEDVDQDAVVALFDRAIAQLRALPSNELYALDAEGVAILEDMARELDDYRAAIAAAEADEFRERLKQRFASNSAGLGLSFGRFYERSSEAMQSSSEAVDAGIKQYKRVRTLGDIYAFLETFLGGSGS